MLQQTSPVILKLILMFKIIIILISSLLSGFVFGQELNCKVIINADQVQTSDHLSSADQDLQQCLAYVQA